MTDEKLTQWLRAEESRATEIVEHNSGRPGDRSLKTFCEYKGYRAAIQAVLWKITSAKLIEEALGVVEWGDNG